MDKYNEIVAATHGDVDFAELRARLGEVTHVRDVVSDTLNHHHRLAGNAQGKTDIRRLTLVGGACDHALEAQGKAHLACAAVFRYAQHAGSRYSSEFPPMEVVFAAPGESDISADAPQAKYLAALRDDGPPAISIPESSADVGGLRATQNAASREVTRLRREIDTRIAGIKSLRQQAIGAAVRYYLAQRGEVELLQDLLKYYLVDVLALTSEAQHEAFVVCELHYFPPSLPSSLQLKQRERIDKLGLPLQPLASEVERQRREDDYKSASERLVEVVEEANYE